MRAGAVHRGSGEDESKNRTGAGRPKQPRRDAQEKGVDHAGAGSQPSRQPAAQLHQRPGKTLGKRREQQREPEDSEENESGNSRRLVGVNRPRASHRGQAGHQRERGCHPGQ